MTDDPDNDFIPQPHSPPEQSPSNNPYNILNLDFTHKADHKLNTRKSISIMNKPSDNPIETIQSKLISSLTNSQAPPHKQGIEKKLEKNLESKYGKGFSLLKKSGYKIGSGLGRKEQGITDPLSVQKRKGNTGIKSNEEYFDPWKNDKQNNFFLGQKRWNTLNSQHVISEEFANFEKIITEYRMNPNNEDWIMKWLAKVNPTTRAQHTKQGNNQTIKNNVVHFLKHKPTKESNITQALITPLNETKTKICEYLMKHYSNANNLIVFKQWTTTNFKDNTQTFTSSQMKERLSNEIKLNLSSLKTIAPAGTLNSVISYINRYINLYNAFTSLYKYTYSQWTWVCLTTSITFINGWSLTASAFIANETSITIKQICDLLRKLLIWTYDESRGDTAAESTTPIFADKRNKAITILTMPCIPCDKASKYYGTFIYKILIEKLSLVIANEWNVKEYQKWIVFFHRYNDVLPKYLLSYWSEAVTNKIIAWLNKAYSFTMNDPQSWNVHLWIHPWFEVWDIKNINTVLLLIQERIKEKILGWDIECSEVNDVLIKTLKPWRNVLDGSYWENELVRKFFLPKIQFILERKFEVDPNEQDLTPLSIVFKLNEHDIVPIERTVPMVEKIFFRKFNSVLDGWWRNSDNSKDKIEEIHGWYKGWKEVFEGRYLKFEEIRNGFKDALILIYKAVKK